MTNIPWNYDISKCKKNAQVLVTLATSKGQTSINIVKYKDGVFRDRLLDVTKFVVAWAKVPEKADLEKRIVGKKSKAKRK